MSNAVLLGTGRFMIPVPAALWQRGIRDAARQASRGLSFMSGEHHRVRDFAVTELARTGAPLSPATIAAAVGLPTSRVAEILDDLEKRLTFIYRSRGADVTWAYPVTVDRTPHRVRSSGDEEAYSP